MAAMRKGKLGVWLFLKLVKRTCSSKAKSSFFILVPKATFFWLIGSYFLVLVSFLRTDIPDVFALLSCLWSYPVRVGK
jgi:hypothetical protein